MTFDHEHYVPCLRWKQGEYQAVLRLSKAAKQSLTPFIEVPEIGFDFETKTENKTIDDHLAPFAGRVRKKWGQEPCFVAGATKPLAATGKNWLIKRIMISGFVLQSVTMFTTSICLSCITGNTTTPCPLTKRAVWRAGNTLNRPF